MPVTIREVSRRCGLSVSSVSKALNNYPDVREETRAIVYQAAREIGYFPNALARGLKTNRTYNLGVLLDDELGDNLTHSFFAVILNAFRIEAEAHGYDITLINRSISARPLSYLKHCKHRRLDGICFMCVDFANPEVMELTRSDVVSVSIDHPCEGIAGVNSDNRGGVRLLVEYARRLGHERIAYVHGTPCFVNDERVKAFREAMERSGVRTREDWLVASHYHSAAHAFDNVRRLVAPEGVVRLEDGPTCLLMADDVSALGGIDALRSLGLSVPGDMSIAGFDGVEMIQRIHPRLTTVHQDARRIGEQAAALLLERIENPTAPAPPVAWIPVTLIEGETVGRI
ncbi:MAG: LacI family transcriptional regulator [Oscillospiraceae bacterium]|jgi:DNA-binding LacI/PurR family transcriptional regulator|nr:LacI family transcriptional regulator [Oscillospiraceae bacterium]